MFEKVEKKKRIILSTHSKIQVEEGQVIEPSTVIAQMPVDREYYAMDVSWSFGSSTAADVAKVAVGDDVKAGTKIAEVSRLFGLRKKHYYADYDGTVVFISRATGLIVIMSIAGEEPLSAGFSGVVEKIYKNSIEIKVSGYFFKAPYGIGQKTWGNIKLHESIKSKDDVKTSVIIYRGKIERNDLYYLSSNHARGVIAGSIDAYDLEMYIKGDFLKKSEMDMIPLVITEGFGSGRMSDELFDFFEGNQGAKLFFDPETVLTSSEKRPEIIVFE